MFLSFVDHLFWVYFFSFSDGVGVIVIIIIFLFVLLSMANEHACSVLERIWRTHRIKTIHGQFLKPRNDRCVSKHCVNMWNDSAIFSRIGHILHKWDKWSIYIFVNISFSFSIFLIITFLFNLFLYLV